MKCWAYTDAGTICGRPAVMVDQARGAAVCERHAPAPSQDAPAWAKKTPEASGDDETGGER